MIDRTLPLPLALRRRYRARHLDLAPEFRVTRMDWAAGVAIAVGVALLLLMSTW